MEKVVIKDQSISSIGMWRCDILPDDERPLIRAVVDLTESESIEKDKNAHKSLLRLGNEISKNKTWEIRGREVESFLKERKTVM